MDTTTTTDTATPKSHFCTGCGRRLALAHKATCLVAHPELDETLPTMTPRAARALLAQAKEITALARAAKRCTVREQRDVLARAERVVAKADHLAQAALARAQAVVDGLV